MTSNSEHCNDKLTKIYFDLIDNKNWREIWVLSNRVLNVSYPETLFKELVDGKNYERNRLLVIGRGCFENEVMIGGIKAYSIPKSEGKIRPYVLYVETLVVDKAYRNQGLGKKLLQYAERKARLHFIHKMALNTPSNNEYAINWYLNNGFYIKDKILNYYEATSNNKDISPDSILLEKII